MDGELRFDPNYIRDISEDVANVSRLLMKHSRRLEDISVQGTIFSGDYSDKANAISKALSRLADSIDSHSREFSFLAEALVGVSYIYENAEEKIADALLRRPSGIDAKPKKNPNYQAKFSLDSLDGANINAGHITSNELVAPDWLMDAAAKFNMFLESEKDANKEAK